MVELNFVESNSTRLWKFQAHFNLSSHIHGATGSQKEWDIKTDIISSYGVDEWSELIKEIWILFIDVESTTSKGEFWALESSFNDTGVYLFYVLFGNLSLFSFDSSKDLVEFRMTCMFRAQGWFIFHSSVLSLTQQIN